MKVMKKIILILIVLLSTLVVYAQKDDDFYKHEIRVAFGDAVLTSNLRLENGVRYTNLSVSYFYRPEIFVWAGINFMNYMGEKTYYHWREYAVNGSFKDFSKSKMKYCAIIAPELRLSYFNRKAIILYSAVSGGIGFENGYDTKEQTYPKVLYPCFHLTCFGLSCNLGKNNNFVLGSELGIGFKGYLSVHAGYRF